MKNDIDKLDYLPKKESRKEYLTRKHGTMWNLQKFDHSWHRSDKNDYAWVKAERIIKKYIGKQYDKAFSEYCQLVEQYEYYRFENYFEKTPGSLWEPEYIIDVQGRIQKNKKYYKNLKKEKTGVWFYSYDYEKGYMNKITGEIVDKYNSFVRFFPEKFEEVIISGFKKWFDSDKDPEYIRLYKENEKQKKLNRKKLRKEQSEKAYSFLTEDEIKRKKSDENDKYKRQAHGFDETSFKGEGYHGQQRKNK